MNHKTAPVRLAIVVLVGLTGCVTDDQLAPVRTFSAAATSFSSQAGRALARLNESYVDRNMAKVASGDRQVSDATFEGVLDNDAGFKASQDALKAIGCYAEALDCIATASYQADIDKGATGLYGSLQSIDRDAGKLLPGAPRISDADLGIVATAVRAVGGVIAEEKRIEAIRKAVHTADPGIQAICRGFAATLAGVRDTYHKNLDVVYTSKFEAYKAEAGNLTYDARLARLAELREARRAISDADALLGELSDSAKALGSAHAKIEASLEDNKLDAASVIREVGQLKSLADDLKTFNAGLKKDKP
ncbi:MAG TPA: hypothetical protein VKG78_08475 [Opitutaceae bacterium]|nr:hypothetical protein [Opitutaceae bacterium]